MKRELEELTEEIRKLREELRSAGWRTEIRFVPQPYPVYVPPFPPPYQPWTPYPYTTSPTIICGNVAAANPMLNPGPVINNAAAARQDVTVYGGLHFT